MIHFACECGQRMTADDEHGGMTSECPQCKQQVSIPQPDAIGADLVAASAVDADTEPAVAVGDEAFHFAEQMGLEVEQSEPDPQSASAVAPDAEDEPFDAGAAAELEFDPVDTSPKARANRAQRSQAAAQRRAQHHFKKAAMPLMLTMSGLLLIFAIWSLFDLARVDAPDSIRQRARWMMLSWPVILVLLFGAWWFRRDVRRSEQD